MGPVEGPRKGKVPARPDALTYLVPNELAVGRTKLCRGPTCGREIVWVQTERGSRAPLDWPSRTPVEGGFELEAHHPHCPDVGSFRRRR